MKIDPPARSQLRLSLPEHNYFILTFERKSSGSCFRRIGFSAWSMNAVQLLHEMAAQKTEERESGPGFRVVAAAGICSQAAQEWTEKETDKIRRKTIYEIKSQMKSPRRK